MKGPIVMSGGGVKAYAAIGVDYPAGAVVTCRKGTKIFTAETTSGQWFFPIPEDGEWTVTATDGQQSKSEVVTINARGQFKRISLSFYFYLFQEGFGVAEGYTCKFGTESGGASLTDEAIIWSTNDGTGNQVWFDPKIKLTDYSKLKVELTCGTRNANSSNYSVTIGVGSNAPTGAGQPNDWVAKTEKIWSTSRAVYEVDIAHCNDYFFVKIAGYATTGTIHNVWFE